MKKLLILLAAGTWGYASAQTNTSRTTSSITTTSSTQASQADVENFIRQAGMIDMMEIQAGNLAKQRAVHSEVRSYGEMMVTDHTNSSKELKGIASRRNIMLPDHSTMHHTQAQGTSGSANMGLSGTSGTTGTRYYSDYQVVQGNADSWRAYNPKNTTRSTEGTETYWTPNFRGKKGISTRNAGSSSNRSMASGGSSSSASVQQDRHMNHDMNGSAWNDDRSVSRTTTNERSANSINGSVSSGDLPTTSSSTNTDAMNSSATLSSSSTVSTSGDLYRDSQARTTTNERSANSINGSVSSGDFPETSTGTSSLNSMSDSGQGTLYPAPMSMDDMNRKLDRLREKTGKNFDEEYLQMMASDHHKAIQLFEKASTSSDAEIRDFATKMLPKLRAHQTTAKQLLDKLDSQL